MVANGTSKSRVTPRQVDALKERQRLAGGVFDHLTIQQFAAYQDMLDRMKRCPGHKLMRKICDAAHDLRRDVIDLLTNYGPDSGSATAKFLARFDDVGRPQDVWDAILSLGVDLELKTSVVDSAVPGIR